MSASNKPEVYFHENILYKKNQIPKDELPPPVTRFTDQDYLDKLDEERAERLAKLDRVNTRRCSHFNIYPSDLVRYFDLDSHENKPKKEPFNLAVYSTVYGKALCNLPPLAPQQNNQGSKFTKAKCLEQFVVTPEECANSLKTTMSRFLCVLPAAVSPPIEMIVTYNVGYTCRHDDLARALPSKVSPRAFDILTLPDISQRLQMPELRLIQYDCGKLQKLAQLLWQLKLGKHRVLIFTQMSKMLDIFEQFLSYHGHTYLRLDGSTRIDTRQALMDRFNADPKVFCFILSTRSGGVGVNLTGADTVVFYDSDWNPTMDAQAQDRCHRIGQTRDVHIYRLISKQTIEENILKKANQKRMLGNLAIEGGNFTTAFFKQSILEDLFGVVSQSENEVEEVVVVQDETPSPQLPKTLDKGFEQALCLAEDDSDVIAAKKASAEVAVEFEEFDENIPIDSLAESEDSKPEEDQVSQILSQVNIGCL